MQQPSSLGEAVLVRLLGETKSENVVVAPVSLENLLAMLAEGAAGSTRQSLTAALNGFGIKPDATSPTPSRVRFACSLWKQPAISLRPAFTTRVHERFATDVRDLPPEGAAAAINAWASEVTEGRITRVVGSLPTATRVFLASAAYFKARWALPFLKAATAPGPFTLGNGTTQDVPMMRLEARLSTRVASAFTAVELGYADGTEVMELVLPSPSLEPRLALAAALAPGNPPEVQRTRLSVPRFKLATDADLTAVLQGLGFASIFDPTSADFGAMLASPGPLHVDRVQHTATLTIDEAGTEAAAVSTATMVGALQPRAPVLQITFNRPFFAILRAGPTGAPLFIGYVAQS